MSVAAVIAWRDRGDPVRRRNLRVVTAWWKREFPDVELVLGDSDHETFSSYRSANAGVRSTDAETLILTDADLIPDAGAVREAITASAEPGIVWPFIVAIYLLEPATERYLAGEDFLDIADIELVADGAPGLIAVLNRKTWELAGGYDERFGGWGFGDTAFAVVGEQLVAPGRRIPAKAIHLWHPRDPDSFPDSAHYQANAALWGRYRAAMDEGPDAVRAVSQEFRP